MGYRAFFSYARADDRVANWLHRQLDSYRTPKALVGSEGALGPVPAKLHPIFRDRTDLQAGGHIDNALQQALEDSETLIVLCTPISAQSHWVNHECETFLRLGREKHIFPVIAAGEPNSNDPDTECFPRALRGKGLLAADLREIKKPNGQLIGDGREGGRLKLIAGLLGLPLDALAQRERRRQRRLVAALSAAVVVFAGVATAAGGFWWLSTLRANTIAEQADEISRERDRAVKGEADARAAQALAEENARQREIQRLLADHNAVEARSTLYRFFAEQAWARHEQGDPLAAARYALAGMRLAPDNAQLYWDALAATMHEAGESLPPLAHDGPVLDASFSPDGARVVTASIDGRAKVWDAADGRLIAVFNGHSKFVRSAAFSPDGARIVTASDDTTAKVWSAADGRLIATLNGHADCLWSAEFSSDGTRIVTASDDNTAKIWNAADGRLLATLTGHTDNVRSAAFSPDGTRVATSSFDSTAKVWNASDGRLIATLSGHTGNLIIASFSPDGARIVTGGWENAAKVWSAGDGRLLATLSGHTSNIRSAAFSPDGARIVTASNDRTAKVWHAADGRLVATLSGHTNYVVSAAFSPNGARIVTVSRDRSAKVWNAVDGRLVATLRGHTDEVKRAAFSPDGARIVTASDDNTAKVWSAAGGRLLRIMDATAWSSLQAEFIQNDEERKDWVKGQTGRDGRERLGYLSPDGARIVTTGDGAGTGKTADVWNAADGRRVATLTGHGGYIESAAFSPDSARIVTASNDHTARVWNAANGRAIAMLRGHAATVSSASFSPDGERIVTASLDKTARVWRAADGQLIATLSGHDNYVHFAIFSPDGARAVSIGDDDTAKVWSAANGRLLATLKNGERHPLRINFSRDGRRIVLTGSPYELWDVRRLTQDWRTLARDACLNLLGPHGRTFSQAEIDADQLLRAEWNDPNRDVCEGAPGVPSIAELRRRAALHRPSG